jgi:3-isopropylmalate/(R)-2-methylmalate dehydratase small subunit
MTKLKQIQSRTVVLPTENIDTDQIIPARFLTTTTRDGLGKGLFADWRTRPDFALNQPQAQGARVLVAGRNFGCGSSREHAVWALADFGFQAVVSTEIADIFKRNALKNGLLPVVLDADSHARLVAAAGAEIVVDLERQSVSLPGGGEARFTIEPFARYCLIEGVDELDFLLRQEGAIREYEQRERS